MTTLLLGAALVVTSCQDGYPIAATRCDRWCDIMQVAECGNYNPAACVSGCEQSFGTACNDEFDALLECLNMNESSIACISTSPGLVPACIFKQNELINCARAAQRPSSN